MLFSDLILTHSNSFTTVLPYRVTPHTHGYYEFVYYVSGSGRGKINDREYVYKENDFVIIPPHCPHEEESFTPSALKIIAFSTDEPILKKLSSFFFGDYPDARVLKTVDTILREISASDYLFREKVTLYAAELAIDVIRLDEGGNKAKDKGVIAAVKSYINENFANQIDFEKLANSLFYSYDYLRHYFKAQTGNGLKEYVLIKRVEYAKFLLATDQSVSSIAKKCGFYSEAHFSTAFKKICGVSPRQYKKMLRAPLLPIQTQNKF